MTAQGHNQDVLLDMLARRRDRAISIVLSVKERECDGSLPPHAASKLRKVVLDQFNELADFAADVCRSLDTGEVVLNEGYLQKLDELYEAVVGNGHGSA